MARRAGIVVTGTEVLTGRVTDRNGPWLAEQLRVLGVDVGYVIVVGDRPGDLTAALTYLAGAGVDLIVTSGGLGPTADDLTADVVASFQGRVPAVDPELERRVRAIIDRLGAGRGWHLHEDATAAAARKQARRAGRRERAGPDRHRARADRPGRRRPGRATGRRPARAAARAAADVAGRAARPGRPGRDRRRSRAAAEHHPAVGHPGVRAGGDAAR